MFADASEPCILPSPGSEMRKSADFMVQILEDWYG
jgi:hypothetical protein